MRAGRPPMFARSLPAQACVGWYRLADGYAMRSLTWPADQAGAAILFLGGRDDFFEKYDDSFAHWHARGWSVDAFDWRGHGGSPRTTDDPSVRHGAGFDRLVADLGDYAAAWRARTPGPHIVMGHSMGGHLLLRALVEGRLDVDATVLLSPMIKIRSPLGNWLSERIARRQVARGRAHASPWAESDSDANRADRLAMMTSDVARYVEEQTWIDQHPDFRFGPPSWGWLADAFGSSRALRADPRLATLDQPLLLMVADHDRLTNSRAARRHVGRLAPVETRRFGRGVAHELLRERDPARRVALATIDAFIERVVAATGRSARPGG